MTYYVCDKCGDLAHITGEPLPDDGSFVCDKCGSAALWQFTSPTKALLHSVMILDRNRSVTAS